MRKLAYNERLPEKIRRALISKAKAENVRLNDAAASALAAHFGVEHRPSGEGYRVERAQVDKIKVSPELHRKIRTEALRVRNGSGTMRGVVLSVLAEQLDLKLDIPRTRRPRPRRET